MSKCVTDSGPPTSLPPESGTPDTGPESLPTADKAFPVTDPAFPYADTLPDLHIPYADPDFETTQVNKPIPLSKIE
jgi:hypothetical protein